MLKIIPHLGGLADYGPYNMVAKMNQNSVDENGWTKVGNLLAGRRGHRTIVLGNNIFHIGGYHNHVYTGYGTQ